MIPYRAFGWLQLIVVAVIMAEGRRQKGEVGACLVAAAVMLIDLPLRWLGNVVPWREYDVDYWAVSRHRGSHIAYIPTWFFGVALLAVGVGVFVADEVKAGRAAAPQAGGGEPEAPPATPPPVDIEIIVREVDPWDGRPKEGRHYQVEARGRDPRVPEQVTFAVYWQPPFEGKPGYSFETDKMFRGQVNSGGFVTPRRPELIRVVCTGVVGADKTPFTLTRDWP